MKLENVVAEIQKIAESASGSRRERFHEITDLVARFLVASLIRDESNGQVSILMLTRGTRQLTFVYPPELRKGNCFPVNRKSVAGQAILTGHGVLSNDVPARPHLGFYERVPGQDGTVHTIQKMMASPIFDERKQVIGVIEASLTGPDPDAAGKDFAEDDLTRLEKLARIFGQHLHQAYPGDDIPEILAAPPGAPGQGK